MRFSRMNHNTVLIQLLACDSHCLQIGKNRGKTVTFLITDMSDSGNLDGFTGKTRNCRQCQSLI